MPIIPRRDTRYESPEPPLRIEQIVKFQHRFLGDMSGALSGLSAFVGDRLGYFRALATQGPVSAREFAERQHSCPSLTAEWLRVMTCAGYLEYDEEQYSLPPEHAMVLANDGGPMCFAGAVQQVGAFAQQLLALLDAFHNGGGLPQASYSRDLYEGMERLSATWFEHELVENWIPALPEVADQLRAGGRVADVGCGTGRALIQMAKAFPVASFVGYDAFPVVVERAARTATAAGVNDRVNFEVRDVTKGLPAEFDLVTAFDSLHDLPDPVNGLREMARGLKMDGTLLVLELALGDDLLEEQGPLGVILHATKLFYNLPVGIAAHGETGGNRGFSESYMRSLCRQAALRYERCMPVRNPLHKLHVIKTQ